MSYELIAGSLLGLWSDTPGLAQDAFQRIAQVSGRLELFMETGGRVFLPLTKKITHITNRTTLRSRTT